MEYFFFSLGFVAAYLLGSIPTAVWVGQYFYQTDIRTKGSGNAGATNTIRVLGIKAGLPVIVVDVFKGYLAVYLMGLASHSLFTSDTQVYFQIVAGFLAVLGHVYPVFAQFKGGKGVATLLGMGIALYPIVIWVPVGIFLVIFLLSGYVSLGSLIGGISFPLADILFFHDTRPGKQLLSIIAALFLLYTHRQNIVRLWHGNENRFKLWKKKT
jgi:glycerol-3-phosphate acyltransferase PlsY